MSGNKMSLVEMGEPDAPFRQMLEAANIATKWSIFMCLNVSKTALDLKNPQSVSE